MSSINSVSEALETAPIGRLLAQYSFPAIAGMMVFSMYNIIDSIFIGQGVGAMAIAGLAVAFPLMNLTFAVSLLVGIGGASLCSLSMGQHNMERASLVVGNVLVLALINSVTFTAVSLFFLDEILLLFGASTQTLPYARDFMQILLLGLPVSFVMFGLNHVMRASGYPKKAMLSIILTVVVNCVLAPIFIFMLNWGIRGAAVATVLSQCAGLVWVLHHYCNPANTLHFKPGIYRLQKSIVLGIFSIGLSPFLMNVCACGVVVLINMGLMTYGGDMAVGAFGVVNRVLILFVMVVVGLTQGMQPVVGYNFGAKKLDRVRRTLRIGIAAGVGIMTVGFVGGQVFPEAIARMFTTDPALIELAVRALRICTVVFPLVGAQIVIGNFFQSIGRAKLSIFLSLTRQLIFLAPFLIILPHYYELDGVWVSIPVSDILATVTAVGTLLIFKHRELKV